MAQYITWNPADKSSRITLSGGDLIATSDGTGNSQLVRGTEYRSSGKWYFEVTVSGAGTNPRIGLAAASHSTSQQLGANDGTGYRSNGEIQDNGGASGAYGATWTTGDIIGVLFDGDANQITFYKNGVSQGPFTPAATATAAPSVSANGGTTVLIANFGASAFAYPIPAGASAWGGSSAEGTASLSAATGAAYAVYGAASFSGLTASGSGDNAGLASLATLTATGTSDQEEYGFPSLEALTSTGTATGGSMAVSQDADLQRLMATGTGSAGSAAAGDATLEALVATGTTPAYTDASFEPLRASGTSLTGTVASAALVLGPLEAEGTNVSQGIATGTPRFQAPTAVGTSLQAAIANVLTSFQRMTAQGAAAGGSAAHGSPSLRPLSAEAEGRHVNVYVGAMATMPLRAHGTAGALLTDTHRTWVVNVGNEAVTEYQNYPFNSFAEFNGRFYAAGDGGLVRLAGDDDLGSDIAWSFSTGLHDGGDAALKRLEEVLLAARFDGPLRVRIWTDEDTYFDHNIHSFRPGVIHQVRAKAGRGSASRFYRVEVSGIGNVAAEVHSMQMPMAPINRRVG